MDGQAKLKAYLESRDLTLEAFSYRVGCHFSQISRIVNGHQRPSWQTACGIEKATKGKVRVSDFYSRAA